MNRVRYRLDYEGKMFLDLCGICLLGIAFSLGVGFIFDARIIPMSAVFFILGFISLLGLSLSFERVKR